MKKRWLLLLLCAACLMGCAYAEENGALEIRVTANPDEIVEPQEISLTFTMKNTSDAAAENVYIASFDGLLAEPIGQIASEEVLTVTRSHSVTQEELYAGEIAYIVSHDDGATGEKVNYTVSAALSKADPRPEVEFTRYISNDIAEAGESVTIAYRVRNTGNVALHTLRVRDALGDFIGRVDVLNAGETKVFLSHIMPTEDCVSEPELTYTIPILNEDSYTISLDAREIHVEPQSISAALTMTQSGDTAKLSLTLSCTGGADWLEIAIWDDIRGELIADHLTLDGTLGTKTISKSYTLRGDTDFRWKITARNECGKSAELVTETLTAKYSPIHAPTKLSLTPQSERVEINRAGRARIGFSIQNEGDTAKNVVLSEATLGDLYTFAVIPSGEPTYREILVDITEDTVLQFAIRIEGEENCAEASVTAAIVRGAANPEEVLRGDGIFSGISEKLRNTSVYVIMLTAACAVLFVLLIILLIQRRRQREERRQRRTRRKKSPPPKPES